MNVGHRVQLGMKGNREERYILIRDGCKLVSAAVLECPKLTDQEVETFAAMKNVQESVLRAIAGKTQVHETVFGGADPGSNPRCPIDVGLPMLKSLLVADLRNLSMNKNVSDTLRKVALKMYKEKIEFKQARLRTFGRNWCLNRSNQRSVRRIPKTIAVVGFSDNPLRASHGVSAYMQMHGYRIIPVNPNCDFVLGEKSYPSLSDVPGED